MGTLAHVLEAQGLATVSLSQVRATTERIRPPRALYCPFPLGRPLGRPNEPSFQKRVLEAAFTLLDRPSGPVLEDFPEIIRAEADEPLACPVPPRLDPLLPEAVDEALALRAAYDRHLAATGRTAVGRTVKADGIAAAVQAFIRIADDTPVEEAQLPGEAPAVASDIRAYYEEAAAAMAEHVPGARAAEAWLFRATATGKVLKRAQARLKEAGVPFQTWYYVVPVSQQETNG